MHIPEAYKLSNYEIILTMDCNLSCPYCYEKHSSKEPITDLKPMSSQTIDKTINFIKESHDKNAKHISLIFFGGEPLLCFSKLKEFVEKFELMLASLPHKIIPHYSATTNLILPDTTQLDYLLEKNFSLLISLDGDEKSHVLSRGQESFYTILNNIAYLHSRGARLSLNLTVTKDNLPYFKDNLIFLNMLGINFRWKINTNDQFTTEDMFTILEALRELSAQKHLTLDESISRIKEYHHKLIPCIDPHRTITINTNGDLLICSRVNWSIGSITEGITKYDEVKDLPLYSQEYHPECKKCSALTYCRGGCLGEHLEGTGINTVKYTLCKGSCIIYKILGIFIEEQKLAAQLENN